MRCPPMPFPPLRVYRIMLSLLLHNRVVAGWPPAGVGRISQQMGRRHGLEAPHCQNTLAPSPLRDLSTTAPYLVCHASQQPLTQLSFISISFTLPARLANLVPIRWHALDLVRRGSSYLQQLQKVETRLSRLRPHFPPAASYSAWLSPSACTFANWFAPFVELTWLGSR